MGTYYFTDGFFESAFKEANFDELKSLYIPGGSRKFLEIVYRQSS